MSDERRSDAGGRDRIDKIREEYIKLAETNRALITRIDVAYHRFNRTVRALLAGLVVIQLGLGIFGLVLLNQNGDRQREIQQLVVTIQNQRIDSIRSNCQSQDTRNLALKQFTAASSPKHPGRQQQQSLAFVYRFVDLLLPYRNCDQQVKQFAGSPPGR